MLFWNNERNCPSPALKKIFDLCQLSSEGSLEECLARAQKALLRPPGKERWELGDSFSQILRRKQFYHLFQDLQLLEPLPPQKSGHASILVLGTTHVHFLHRLNHALKIASKAPLVLLTGERLLTKPERKELSKLYKTELSTETELAECIAEAHIPPGRAVTIISAPMRIDGRPRTAETIECWLAKRPTSGTHLLVSEQPYGYYQKLVADNILRINHIEGIALDITIAPFIEGRKAVSIVLDTIARTLYELAKADYC